MSCGNGLYVPGRSWVTDENQNRRVTIGWLIDVCHVYNIEQYVVDLAVRILDIYMSSADGLVPESRHIQTVACACFDIAIKQTARVEMNQHTLVFLSDNACSLTSVAQAEGRILQKIRWHIPIHTPWCIIQPYDFSRTLDRVDTEVYSNVVRKAMLYHPSCTAFEPAQLAAAVVTLVAELTSRMHPPYERRGAESKCCMHICRCIVCILTESGGEEDACVCGSYMGMGPRTLRATLWRLQAQMDDMADTLMATSQGDNGQFVTIHRGWHGSDIETTNIL